MIKQGVYGFMILLVFTVSMNLSHAEESKFLDYGKKIVVLGATAAGVIIVAKITASAIKIGAVGAVGALAIDRMAQYQYDKNGCDDTGAFAIDDLYYDIKEIATSSQDRALFLEWITTEGKDNFIELSNDTWEVLANDRKEFIKWCQFEFKETLGNPATYQDALGKLHSLLNKMIDKD